jgi:hypothetical protein
MEEEKVYSLDLPEIGNIKISLTDDQFKKLLENGQKTLDPPKKSMKDYVYRDGNPVLGNSKGGMTGNSFNWEKYFPEITKGDLDSLINAATEKETTNRKIATTLFSLLTAGLTSYFKSSSGQAVISQIKGESNV